MQSHIQGEGKLQFRRERCYALWLRFQQVGGQMDQVNSSRQSAEEQLTGEGRQALAKSVDGRTIPHAYLRRVEISGADPLYLVKRQGKYTGITWEEVHAKVLGVVEGLRKAGIQN